MSATIEAPVKLRWVPMELAYEGDVGVLIQMPGNGKTHMGQDPGDELQPRGLHKKEGCEDPGDATHPGTPPGHDPNCPEQK